MRDKIEGQLQYAEAFQTGPLAPTPPGDASNDLLESIDQLSLPPEGARTSRAPGRAVADLGSTEQI